MKKVGLLFWVAAFALGSSGLFAVCTNNAQGAMHKKGCKGRYVYECTRKPAEAYGRSADKFYTNGACNYCGCSSQDHKRAMN